MGTSPRKTPETTWVVIFCRAPPCGNIVPPTTLELVNHSASCHQKSWSVLHTIALRIGNLWKLHWVLCDRSWQGSIFVWFGQFFLQGSIFFGLNRLGMFFAGLHVLGLYPSWNVFAGFHFFGLDKNQQKKQKCKFEHVGPLKPCFDRPQPTRKTQFLTSSNFQAALVVKLFAIVRWHGTIH